MPTFTIKFHNAEGRNMYVYAHDVIAAHECARRLSEHHYLVEVFSGDRLQSYGADWTYRNGEHLGE